MSSHSSAPCPPCEQMDVKEEPLDLPLFTCDNPTTVFTPRKDKALKREAMHLEDGEPATGRLETWLEHYRPTDHHGQQQRTELLKHTELVARTAARKAANKQCLERTRVLYASAHQKPRPRNAPQSRVQQNARVIQRLLAPRLEAMRGGRRIFRKRF
ncbi:hypothetical protein B0H14DRAFT_2632040 [Mycena olivaceomarginata]|nr:hypothetical protein B0H14DRAFT_2632040 [Mycena olivaceomarginata]